MSWLFLTGAIVFEVGSTLSLRLAADRGRGWYAVVIAGYLIAFTFLSLTLAHGLGIGVAYGIWTAAGVALTAVASRYVFGEPLTRTMVIGVVLVIAGVLLLELGAH